MEKFLGPEIRNRSVSSCTAFKGSSKIATFVLANLFGAMLGQNAFSAEAEVDRAPASTTSAAPTSVPINNGTKTTPEKADEAGGLFGSWFGLKTVLSEHGMNLRAKYKAEVVQNTGGGERISADYLGNFDLILETDLEKLVGAKGLSLILYGLGDHGGKPKTFVGDSFATSNIEAPNTFRLYEAYLKKAIDDRFIATLGLRDLNADFYATESTASLLNSAFGVSPSLSQTGVNGPSIFPVAAMAASIRYQSPTSFYYQTGLFNAIAGDPENKYGTHFTIKND